MTGGAERLRRAAEVLRERAEAATEGPWAYPGDGSLVWSPNHGAPIDAMDDRGHNADADYIATVDPVFGLAVADLLDGMAAWVVFDECSDTCDDPCETKRGLAVADAVLNEGSER